MRRNIIDRLALLCTLHADGPKTLRLLREAGYSTFDKLRKLEPDRLAKILNLSSAAARRLLREIGLLEKRLEPDLEREEVMYPPTAGAGAMKPAPPGHFRVDPEPPPVAGRSSLGPRDRQLLDKVVARWRQADEETHRLEAVDRRPEPEFVEAEEKVVEIPTTPPPDPLLPGLLGGLDAAACDSLAGGGIVSLEELATCPVDELVERSGLSFTRARTLQFLAGRRLTEAVAEEEEPVRLSSVPPERSTASMPESIGVYGQGHGNGTDEGAGGPFV
jgi:hypothetical protein